MKFVIDLVPKVGLEPTSQVFQTSAVTILATSARSVFIISNNFCVPLRGLEPPWLAPYASETYVCTNFTTAANVGIFYLTSDKIHSSRV